MSKEFQELTIKDTFMFAAVMADNEQCRKFLELSLGMKILSVAAVTEKTLSYHPGYHGVRLDVLAEENGTRRRFNVEMQVERPKSLPRRTRYYHSQMDMDILATGVDYAQLPNTYVIFICDFAPFRFGRRLYRYTCYSKCEENGRVLEDGRVTVILSTKGENDDEVPKPLVHFLKYVENPEYPAEDIVSDDYVRSLSVQIAAIKRSRDWEAKFVRFKEMMNEERETGRKEGRQARSQEAILELLGMHGDVPEDILLKINQENDEAMLKRWLLDAAKSTSLDDFRKRM